MSIQDYFQASKDQTRKKNIFISYRERDTAAETGRLVDSLKQYFNEDQIFMDIDKIEPGTDFTKVISTSLEVCDVMLAVIGQNWKGVHAETGGSRLMDPKDWVRTEIATALKRNIRVVPVLVDGASLPAKEDLPEDLQPLLNRQAYELSNKRWRYDTENLTAFLEKIVGIPIKPHRRVEIEKKPSGMMTVVKYGLGVLGALFIILVIAEMMKTKPTTIDKDQKEGIIDNRLDNDSGKTPDPIDGGNGGNKRPDPPAPQNMDINGVWNDKNGLYYLDILQNNDQLEVTSYSIINGLKTGSGYGKINGRDCTFQISVTDVGVLSAETKLLSDEGTLQGTFIIENNGAKYSEPLVLLRRK